MKRFLLAILSILTLGPFFFVGKVSAAEMPVPGIHFPCDQTANPEFASLRPYQAAHCGDADKALYCSNELLFVEGFSKFDNICRPQAKGLPDGPFICTGSWDVPDHVLEVDLANSELPILGNTELTKNSSNNQDQIDDATKVSEYASWYLNGTINRAEYGENDPNSIATFAGPIQKIMPQAILEAQRMATIASASAQTTYTAESDDGTPSQQVTEAQSHNQIVVCAQNGKPIECYDGNGSPTKGTAYRLTDWTTGSLGIARDISNLVKRAVDLVPGVGNIASSISSVSWNKREPPLPWGKNEETGKTFTYLEYQKAYNEWRGQSCIIIPILKKLICINNPLIVDTWSNLFPYIPLASTPDKRGSEVVTSVQIKGEGKTKIVNSSYDAPKNAPLWFAHTQEVKDLSEFLNKSYTPKGVTNDSLPATTETNDCNVVNVRANPGDNLFPEKPPNSHGVYVPGVRYTITEVPCVKETVWEEKGNTGRLVKNWHVSCDAEVSIKIPTIIKAPWLDNIWESTVANSGSTFRKIYPKVEEGAPVSCIADIPGSTGVDYSDSDTLSAGNLGGSYDFSYKNPAVGSNDASELYFPHLGSVYDYFLKGIQTALLPSGYGAPTPISGTLCQKSSENFGNICAVADAYHIPCCQLKGIAELETGGGNNVGGGSCSTKNGTFKCCNGNVCGPSQVACGQYDAFAGNDKIDMCDPVGSAELLARAMLLKLCQASGKCDSYDWNTMKSKAMQFKVQDGNYTAAAYFYGLANGCTVNACTEYRWGAGKTYCDSVEAYCKTGKVLPDNTSPQFCAKCNEDLVRAGQTPINCSNP